MTSNIGASSIGKQRTIGFSDDSNRNTIEYESMKDSLISQLKSSFSPEFLNRIDDVIVFHKLNEEDTRKIAALMLATVSHRLEERNVHLTFTEEVVDKLAKQGFDPDYGARPMRRVIQNSVEDALSEELLKGEISLGDNIEMSVENDRYAFKKI